MNPAMNLPTPPPPTSVPRVLIMAGMLIAATVLLPSCASFKRVAGGLLGIVTESVPEEQRGRSLKGLLQDRRTVGKIKAALATDPTRSFSTVNVSIYDGTVLLTGHVRNARKQELATAMAERVHNVRTVLNELQIVTPRYINRIHDNILVGKVKSKLAARSDINVDRVKVVGSDRTIYLLGSLPEPQRQLVARVAEQVDGLRAVVNWITPQ